MLKLTTDAKKFSKALGKIEQGLQKATARTLTAMAREADAQQKKNLEERMTVRTPFTLKSTRVYPASETKPIARQNSIVGSFSPYLAIHDQGGRVKPKKRVHVIATTVSRSGSEKNVIRRKLRLDKIGPLGPKARKSAYFALPSGIYYRKGKAGAKKRQGGARELVKVRTFSRKAYRIKATHWHTDAVKLAGTKENASRLFIKNAEQIIRDVAR